MLLFSSCEKASKEHLKFLEQCSNADSLYNYHKENKKDLSPGFLGWATGNFRNRGLDKEVRRLFTLRTQDLNKSDSRELTIFYIDKATDFLGTNPDSARIFLDLIDKNIVDESDTLSIPYYQVFGHYYYVMNQLDSSTDMFNMALGSAMELGDTSNMGRIATSLGGLQSIMGNEQSAIEYLMRAVSYDPQNLVLANNLASVLTGQKQYKKALELLDEHKDKLFSKFPGPEELMYRLTYIHLMQEMGNWNDSRRLLKNMKPQQVPRSQIYNYHSFWALQWSNDDKSRVGGYLDDIIAKEGVDGYSELFYYLSGWTFRMPMETIHAHYMKNLNSLDTSIFDLMTYSVYYDILSKKSQLAGDVIASSRYLAESSKYVKRHYSHILEAKELDLLSRLNLYNLEKKYATTRLEAENIKLTSKRKSLILGFALFLLTGISIVWYRQNRLNSQNERLTRDLFNQKQRELEILEREKETSKKLVELSSRILETSKNLKSKLMHLPEKNLPGIRESIQDLDYILFLNQSVDTTVIASGYDFSKFEFLGELIESQRNVLNLSLDSYRPKEIAVTLNLSYSYVRNVQSRLRKVLKDNGYETFEEFKKFLDS